jgi:hypothetical protein
MRYEPVYAVWDYYDGVRTGIADFDGTPHYFASIFDEDADEYSDAFWLYPVGPEFMQHAMRYSAIFRAWEVKFYNGSAALETHPGHGGIDAEYDRLRIWIDNAIKQLTALPVPCKADFQTRQGQEALAPGMLRDLVVAWSQALSATLP